ncbi:MAG: DoxX family protein [Muribaculaceae bacterium]|nr:DoxX family protein [Muribaculaceae bacterium]
MKAAAKVRLRLVAVWCARIIVGATFILSGWSKAIDPWGFMIKVEEYLAAWGWTLPEELVLAPCVALSCVEFCTGVLIACGSLKRVSVWCAAAMMLVMLPLTLYIAIANPVADCGCFGDFLLISNWATFGKNVLLCILIAYLAMYNSTVKGIYAAPIQWLVIALSLAFPLSLSLLGFHIQPVVDFRPYRTGTPFFGQEAGATDTYYIYEKDGQRQQFDLSALPDSTWTFVDVAGGEANADTGFEIRDDEGYSMNAELADAGSPQLYLVVAEPDTTFLRYAQYANTLSDYATAHGVDFVALAGAARLAGWRDLVRPRFEVYSAEDTSLKQLVRGHASLVYVDADGLIRWKRTLNSLPHDIADDTSAENRLASVKPVDDGRLHLMVVSVYLLGLLLIYLLSLSPKILRIFVPHTEKNT